MKRKHRALLLGSVETSLLALLFDLLGEMDVEVSSERPDVTVAFVEPANLVEVLGRARAQGAPVVALCGYADETLARAARAAGADVVCSLDAPLDGFRRAVAERLSP
jgi:hypothetical protein